MYIFLAAFYVNIWLVSLLFHRQSVDAATASIVLAGLLILLSAVDLKTYRLPDQLVGALSIAGVAVCLAFNPETVTQNILAAVVIGLLIVAGNQLYFRARGRDGIGMGDAKLLAAGTVWVGAVGSVSVVLWACLTGLAHCLSVAAFKRKLSGMIRIPFGPHLALGIWLVWLFGPAS
jgi:leader peptidase (prepilin peptidase)/N-methyltransferase